ncbi:hypothetical protein [Mycolicibacterium thermoresistibile]
MVQFTSAQADVGCHGDHESPTVELPYAVTDEGNCYDETQCATWPARPRALPQRARWSAKERGS